MGRIVVITGYFDVMESGRPTGKKELLVSHGVDEDTCRTVVLPSEHPRELGAAFDSKLCEWVLPDPALQARVTPQPSLQPPSLRSGATAAADPAAPKPAAAPSPAPRRVQMFRR